MEYDKTPLTKNELFEILDRYDFALKRCEQMKLGSQRLAIERRYRSMRRSVRNKIEKLLLRDERIKREVAKGAKMH